MHAHSRQPCTLCYGLRARTRGLHFNHFKVVKEYKRTPFERVLWFAMPPWLGFLALDGSLLSPGKDTDPNDGFGWT